MNKLNYIITIVFLLSSNYLNAGINNERYRYNFNYGWKLLTGDIEDAKKQQFDDSSWKNISCL
jgi:hypothetical protein